MVVKSDGLEKIQTEFVKRDNYQSEDIRWVVKLQSLQKLFKLVLMEAFAVISGLFGILLMVDRR